MAPKGPISRSSGGKPSDELRITGMSTIADRLGFRPRNHDALGDRNDRYGSEFASVADSNGCRQPHSSSNSVGVANDTTLPNDRAQTLCDKPAELLDSAR